MMNAERAKLLVAVVILAAAAFLCYRFVRQQGAGGELAFFYDLSERKLFAAPRDSIPPIKGINNAEEDAVRAIVIATNGNIGDRSARSIAYLEKYSPALKAQMLKARKESSSPEMGRSEALSHRYVRRVGEEQWFPLNTPEGERILTDWAQPGAGGITPVVCSP
jgi:hypothetical protein